MRSMKLFQQSYATAPPHVVSILTNRASAKPPPYTENVRRHDGEKSGGFHGEKSRGFHGEKSGVFGGAAGTDQEKRVQPPPLSVSCAPPGCHAHQDRPMARAPPPARQAVQEPPPDPDPSVSNHTIFKLFYVVDVHSWTDVSRARDAIVSSSDGVPWHVKHRIPLCEARRRGTAIRFKLT